MKHFDTYFISVFCLKNTRNNMLLFVLLSFMIVSNNLLISQAQVVNDLSEYSVDEFDNEVEIHESVFVKFYTPHCPHCKSMAGEFVKTALEVQGAEPPISLAEVDCTSDIGEHICAAKNIKGYPTLKLYKYGSFYQDYQGRRTRRAMSAWLMSHNHEKTKRFLSIRDMDNAIRESTEIVVTGVFGSADTPLFHSFLNTSYRIKRHKDYRAFKDILFYHSFMDEERNLNAQSKKTFAVLQGLHLIGSKGHNILLYRPKWMHSKHESSTEFYVPKDKKEKSWSLTKWIASRAHGIFGFRNKQTDLNIHDPLNVGKLVVVFLPFDPKTQINETQTWRDQVIPFAQQFASLTFVMSKMTDYYEHLKEKMVGRPLIVDPSAKPLIIVYDNLTVPYVMQEEFTQKTFGNFLTKFVEGQLEGSLKMLEKEKKPLWQLQQESVNITVDESKIREVTAKNFSSSISFNGDHVLLLLYKNKTETKTLKINRIMDDLNSQYETEKKMGVSFLKMNCTENEVPRAFDTTILPRVYFVHGKTKRASRFREIVNKNNIVTFMMDEAKKGKTGLFSSITHEKVKTEL